MLYICSDKLFQEYQRKQQNELVENSVKLVDKSRSNTDDSLFGVLKHIVDKF